MTKRQKIHAKYNGLCAYTGKPLGDDWQIDHMMPKIYLTPNTPEINALENLMPCLKIINHYKSSLTLEGFRKYIARLQSRIDKLPKWTINYVVPDIEGITLPLGKYDGDMWSERRKYLSWKRGEYIKQVALLFGITKETPFSGKFYFETLEDKP
jgi:hypothetical protein